MMETGGSAVVSLITTSSCSLAVFTPTTLAPLSWLPRQIQLAHTLVIYRSFRPVKARRKLLMPNGGTPLLMVLRPNFSEACVFYAKGNVLHFITIDEWEGQGAESAQCLSITVEELGALKSLALYRLGKKDRQARLLMAESPC